MTLGRRRGVGSRVLGFVGASVLSFVLITLSLPSSAPAYSLYDPPRIVPRVDYSLGMVFLERWRGDYFIGVEQVLPIDKYLEYQLAQSVREAWQEESRREREKQMLASDASGLIPDIILPKLPIFGEGSKIDISGKDRITLGGRQTFVHEAVQLPGSGRLFPELKMEQQLSVVLNGTIGERTKVSIDHDSERQEAQNKVVLSYTGTEDDVIQAVELGDTRLTIPGTGYTGDLPAHHGLFGATARGKVGGVDVYAIASREQSQSQTQSFTGKRRVSVDTIYEYRYVTRRFYYLDAPGTITNLRVYVDDRNPGNNQSAYKAIATVFPDAPDSIPSHWTYDRAPGDFDLKSLGKDYLLQPGNVLEFTSQLGAQEVVGLVIYTNQDTIGGNKKQDTLILKLLKPQMPDSLSLTWDYELRNVYQLPQSDISLSSFSLQFNTPQGSPAIETDTAGANQGRKLTDILGLDPNLDGRLEYPEFDGKTGLVRFPGRRPFDSSALSTRDRIIYRVDPMSLDPGLGRMYRMVVEYSSAAESYYLGQPDISERSERVVVDGETWSRDRDYTIDYRSGVLSFLRALPPNANIQVTFEYRPLFSLAEKSLVGARAEYAPGPQGKLGASAFFRSEGANDEKPALGSEPFRRVIAETDASYTVNSDALTAFLDRLPLLRAQSPSSFGAAAEAAVSLPDPNTRGVAYLDDFEGTSVVRSVSNSALLWSYASVPVEKDTECFARTRLAWNSADRIRNDSVFGSTGEDDDYDRHDVLRVVFTPDPGDRASWAGMMTSAAQAGMSMNLKDVENLRMILKTRRTTGTIHVTVGMAIDEDAPRRNRAGAIVGLDGRNNTEDRNANGVLDEDEDTGLDTIAAADSLWVEGENGDDGNDDYHPVSNAMGTEGNQHLDAEDLDRNGFSRYNHYFECVLSLGDQRYFSDLALGWKLCRVSLRDSVCFKTVGKPRWEDIRYVRVWFDGFDEPDTIDFYSIEFVGSRWTNPQLGSTRDTARPPGRVPPDTTEKVWVTQVSRKTDATYTSPFQTKRDAQGRVEQEASLLLGYRNLNRHRRATVRKSSADREDYREYRELRLYVHDDGNGLVWLIRLGSDSANYYEYRDRITKGNLVPGRDGKWYEFVLPLDSFPILKQRRAQADVPVNVLWSSGPWRVLGNPSLADVRHTALGLENPDRTRISGGIWFNDLRLYGPRRETGYGFQARSNAALSDFVTVGATFDYSDPNFRRFSEGRGIKSGGGGFGANLGASLRANLDRLLPAGWGLSAPLSYSVSDQRDVPKYSPLYPDLRLASEGLGLTPPAASPFTARGRSEELAVDDLRKQKSANRWLNYTLEGMGFSWRARRARSLSSLTWDSTQASAARWLYSVSPDLKLKLGQDDELALFPQGIRFGLTDGRQSTRRGSRISLDSSYRVTVLKGHSLGTDFGVEYSPLEDLSFDYGVQTDRDLLVPSPDTFWFLKLGNESGREHSFDASYNLELADIFSPGIDYSGDYSDDRVKSGLGYDTLRNMNNSGELEFTLNTDLPELLGKLEPASGRPAKSGAQRHRPEPKPEPAPPEPVLPEPEPTGQEDSLPPVGEDPRPRQTPVGEDSRPRQTPVGEDSRPRQGGDGPVETDSQPRRPAAESPWLVLGKGAGFLSRSLDPLDFSYSISRTSDLTGVRDASPWYYRLGFADLFPFDSLLSAPNAMRERRNTLRASSGGRVRDFSARVAYEWSQGNDLSNIFNSKTLDRSVAWPSLDLTQNRVHNLFKRWATDSKVTASYRRRHTVGGDYVRFRPEGDTAYRESLGMYGRSESDANEFSPLLSWNTTWKKRVSTTLSTNYTYRRATSFLNDSGSERSITYSRERGLNLSLSYAFSAPHGLKLPLLKKLKFSSDLSLTWSLRFSQNQRWQQRWSGDLPTGEASNLQRDNTFGTSLAASYRFSRTIEAGLNTSYSQSRGLSKTWTETMDLNLWVLFRF